MSETTPASVNNPSGASLIEQARGHFVGVLTQDTAGWLSSIQEAAQILADSPTERHLSQARWDWVQELRSKGLDWAMQLSKLLRAYTDPNDQPSTLVPLAPQPISTDLALLDDAVVDRDIAVSRLGQSLLDKAMWEYNDLRGRIVQLTRRPDLEENDLFRPAMVAKVIHKAWALAGLSQDAWRGLEAPLHRAATPRVTEAYHETNRWLIDHGVMPEIDLRPFIRKADNAPSTTMSTLDGTPGSEKRDAAGAASAPSSAPAAPGGSTAASSSGSQASANAAAAIRAAVGGGARGGLAMRQQAGDGPAAAGGQAAGAGGSGIGGSGTGGMGGAAGAHSARAASPATTLTPGSYTGLSEETHLLTRPVNDSGMATGALLEEFGQIIERHVPGFKDTVSGRKPSQRLQSAMDQAQQRLQAASAAPNTQDAPTPEMLVRTLRERTAQLKDAAQSPGEKAVIELVAMLFQAILSEERLPAGVRIWFARLQMPTLRVALAEPEFFSSEAHPARRLLDRMGACVMGFEGKGGETIDPALQAEIKRIVQTIEAFPDTGRRVFQTVLAEFEKFIEAFFREHSEAARQGVSLAQQIEQRETLAIQYTIELRKMLADVPVDDAVRTFLFKVWADVLATVAVRHGRQSANVARMREAAGDLIWLASAKTTLSEREQALRRSAALVVALREGMRSAGVARERQDEEMRQIQAPMVEAFSAKAQALTDAQMRTIQARLVSIEDVVADESIELGDEWMLSEALQDQPGVELVSEGGSMPTPKMQKRAGELRSGDLFVIEHRGLRTPMRLAWTGRHRQLTLFVSEGGRCVLFPKARLAAYLQAGLVVPAHEESLTLSATRAAIQQINQNPQALTA